MTVTINLYGSWRTFTGTLAEVVGALNTEGIPQDNLMELGVDAAGTAYYAVVHK